MTKLGLALCVLLVQPACGAAGDGAVQANRGDAASTGGAASDSGADGVTTAGVTGSGCDPTQILADTAEGSGGAGHAGAGGEAAAGGDGGAPSAFDLTEICDRYDASPCACPGFSLAQCKVAFGTPPARCTDEFIGLWLCAAGSEPIGNFGCTDDGLLGIVPIVCLGQRDALDECQSSRDP